MGKPVPPQAQPDDALWKNYRHNVVHGALGLYWLIRSQEVTKPATPRQDAVDAMKFGIPLIPHVIEGFLISTVS